MNEGEHKVYCASYNYAGRKWALNIPAKSFEDAKGHLSHMSWGTVDGELMGTIPAGPSPKAVGLAVRLICWARNTWESALRSSA